MNNNDGSGYAFFVGLLLFMGLYYSVAIISVDSIEYALEICKNNGGLRKIDLDFFTDDAYCNNGVSFPMSLSHQSK